MSYGNFQLDFVNNPSLQNHDFEGNWPDTAEFSEHEFKIQEPVIPNPDEDAFLWLTNLQNYCHKN